MELVLSRDGVKRKIEGPFELCGSRADLAFLVKQLEFALSGEFHYGWITILPRVDSPTNTPPRGWTE